MSGDRRRVGRAMAAAVALALGPLALGPLALGPTLLDLSSSAAWGDQRSGDRRIRESSGLAASQRSENRFWTHNDSGDSARLFALDRTRTPGGAHQGEAIPGEAIPGGATQGGVGRQITAVGLAGAEAVDWEDMASGVIDGRATLVVADVGDNGRRRARVTLYVLDEPVLPPNDLPEAGRVVTVPVRQRIEVRYPDGPRDCEAIGIDAERRRVICISKELLPFAGIYSVPLPPAEGEPANREVGNPEEAAIGVDAERLGTLPLPMVTGMDIRGDGLQMAITGYFDLFLFDRHENESWEVALRRAPKHIPLPKLKQVEAVCFDRQGELWVTSEGDPMPLLRIPTASDGEHRTAKDHDD